MTYLFLLLTYLFFHLCPIIALIVFYVLYYFHKKNMLCIRTDFVSEINIISASLVRDISLINLYGGPINIVANR